LARPLPEFIRLSSFLKKMKYRLLKPEFVRRLNNSIRAEEVTHDSREVLHVGTTYNRPAKHGWLDNILAPVVLAHTLTNKNEIRAGIETLQLASGIYKKNLGMRD